MVALAGPVIQDGDQMAVIWQCIQSKIAPLVGRNQGMYHKFIPLSRSNPNEAGDDEVGVP
jgi:hypothetical protein